MNHPRLVVSIDPAAGFCTGVRRAIRAAETLLANRGQAFSVGEIVHNEAETGRLRALGLSTLKTGELQQLPQDAHVLFRAHGEPPSTYNTLETSNLSLTDATCPVVLRLQHKVGLASAETAEKSGTVVIFGKPGHPEVVGLQGHARGKVLVLSHADQIEEADLTLPLHVFAQTTSHAGSFKQFCEAINARFPDATSRGEVSIHQTICAQVSKREPALEKFAREHDVVIFVTGSRSSNGKYLSERCTAFNPRTHVVSGPGELDSRWFAGAASAGVSGATSTPIWLMEEVASAIEKMTSEASCT